MSAPATYVQKLPMVFNENIQSINMIIIIVGKQINFLEQTVTNVKEKLNLNRHINYISMLITKCKGSINN